MNKKFLIFKPDGVLVDTVKTRKEKIYSLLREIGLDPANRADLEEIIILNWGKSIQDLFCILCGILGGGNLEYKKFLEIKNNNIINYPEIDAKLMKTISKLKEEHGLGIITCRKTTNFLQLIKKTKLDLSPFDLVQTADNCQGKAFHQKIFDLSLAWAEEISIPKENIIYFGNTERHDYLPALNAGINFVGVLSGVSTKEDFIQRGLDPEKIVDFEFLPDYLEKSFINEEKFFCV